MRHRRQPTRRQLLVAVGVSLLLHSGVIGTWYASRGDDLAVARGPNVLVDAPDDVYTVLTICDEPRAEARVDIGPPHMLPSEVVRDVGPSPAPKAPPTPAGHVSGATQQGGTAAHTGAGASPLHGKMKAGKSIVYVLDRSSSMSDREALTRAKASLLASLRQLDETVRFQIVAYNSSSRTFGPELCLATTANIERVAMWLNELPPEGRSEHRVGVREGLYFKSDALFLLTDADDLTANDVKTMEGDIRQPIVVYAVLFGSSATPNSPLARFVQNHRGVIRYVGSQP